MSGSVIAEDAERITITNAIFGKIVVPWAQVERRERITNEIAAARTSNSQTSAPPAAASAISPELQVRLNDLLAVYMANQISAGEYHKQRTKLLADDSAKANYAKAGAQPKANGVPAPALVNPAIGSKPVLPTARPPKPKHWSGEALAGADLGFGEKRRQLYTARLKLNYVQAPIRNALDYLFTYGQSDGELSANRMDGSIKSDYELGKRLYLYSLAGGGYDEIRKIDWRYELGPGVGYQALRLTNFVLKLETGFHYEVQNFTGHKEQQLYHYRLAEEVKWNIGMQFTLDEKVEYLPQVDTLHEYKLRYEANLRYWLRSNLSLNLTLIDIYDTVTAPGVGKNDLQVRSSLGLKF